MSTKEPMAFPTINNNESHYAGAQQGMTLRDYFAAHAPFTMTDVIESFISNSKENQKGPTGREIIDFMVALRFSYADAILAERAK